jgi:MoaA/NifB/PqqE/SkfB family radical SAM enzyme
MNRLRLHYLTPDVLPEQDVFKDKKEIIKLKKIIKEIDSECHALGIHLDCVFKELLKNDAEIDERQDNSLLDYSVSKCVQPWINLFIDSNGQVMPDCECSKPVGNIFNDSIQNIWNSPDMQEYRNKIINGTNKGWCSDYCTKTLSYDEHIFAE